ncbi:MAG: ribosome assembly RNA-binding protein YhbY [Sodalis sp. (in: enterobacteria)]|uniref:ribosome assembly RNA-binding protein YhbY n=1 Tax=Sodalis sp. (in: enterobacteria) TaxID=1898979 RepID=UPI003F2A0520
MNLNNKQKQQFNGLANSLKPVVMLAEIEQALEHYELIKVKIAAEERETKTLIADAIVRESGASKVQVIGNILVLYRPAAERKITLLR